MRTIKFRGKTSTGEWMFGNYKQDGNEGYIYDCKRLAYVKSETVTQLVYVDKDGKEYYEGDTITKDGRTWKCFLKTDWQEVSHEKNFPDSTAN